MAVYENPIQRDDDYADPFVLRHDGRYYLYATNPDIRCWSSDDLVHWRAEGPTIAPDAFPGLVPFAPEVVYSEGAFYLYTSPSGHGHHVLRSESPTGPFVDISGNVGHAIDGNVLIDDDGRWYFYWAGDEGIWACEMPSPTEFGEPVLTGIHMNGWTEGPFVSKRDGRYHMTLTGNHYLSPGYRIDAAFSDDPLSGWKSGPLNPIVLSTADGFRGLGHSSSVTGPDLVSTYLIYHNMNPDLTRHLDIDRQVWNGAALQVLGPSRAAPVPAPPDARCGWEEGESGWIVESGRLVPGDRAAVLVAEPDGVALWSTVPASRAFTVEISLTALGAHGHGLNCIDESGARVELRVDAPAHRVTAMRAGALLASVALPPSFMHDALHTWRVVADGEGLELFLDGRRQFLLSEQFSGMVSLGVMASGGSVRIGHCAFTATTPQIADRSAVAPVPGRLWATHSPTVLPTIPTPPDASFASVSFGAGETHSYRLHAARAGEFLLQLAGRFVPGDELGVSLGAGEQYVLRPVSEHVMTTTLSLDAGENELRIEGVAGQAVLTLLTIMPAVVETTMQVQETRISGFGKRMLDPSPRADAEVRATVSFTADEPGGHADLLLRAGEFAEGGEGDDTRLGVDFLLGYSVQFHADRLVLARHDYDERVLAASPLTIDPTCSYDVGIRIEGERIAVRLDGSTVLEAADTLPHASGAIGVRAAGGSLRMDRLDVGSISPARR